MEVVRDHPGGGLTGIHHEGVAVHVTGFVRSEVERRVRHVGGEARVAERRARPDALGRTAGVGVVAADHRRRHRCCCVPWRDRVHPYAVLR